MDKQSSESSDYLVKTRDRGLEFVPNLEEGLDCYVDADFAGLWGS